MSLQITENSRCNLSNINSGLTDNFLEIWLMKKILLINTFYTVNLSNCYFSTSLKQSNNQDKIIPAAERINVYLPFLKNKKVGIFANHTSTVGNSHLVDTLQKLGVDIRVIFGPEHGFRGNVPMVLRSWIIKMRRQVFLLFHFTAAKEDHRQMILKMWMF
jgi:uncharacterized protein YbbC (DUF1343 family)